MKVCYFGIYDPEYIRNKVNISGLEANGIKVIECIDRTPGLKKFLNLYKKHRAIRHDYDAMIVGFPGQLMVPFAKLITRKPVIHDAFVPLFDALVYNHKTVKKYSLKGLYYWLLDYVGVHLPNLVLTDTNEHAKYYIRHFKAKKNKCRPLYIGANTEIFKPIPRRRTDNDYIVEFHAIVYEEHGIDYILEAARILKNDHPDVKFVMIGASARYDAARKRAKNEGLENMLFAGRKPLKDIPQYIADADVCLGLFGKTEKTLRVIPNKAYEIIACAKPLINARTAAMTELFSDRENCLFCDLQSGDSLARAIVTLKNDEKLRESIAGQGYRLFQEKLTPIRIGKDLADILHSEFKIL